ncbi:DUF1883 domain-containing protein [Frigoribacterium sp. RIT-PI-h]|uniref:DUF1883 domain-containing protein n=1 Tax=Frigoribacterium sp. RIT-PI-h TaxID=1690245 RepID=UPI0009E8BFD8|nr:DUF1883 domain-containing protein [Frigoribacterium sp. RIT-PI-h]
MEHLKKDLGQQKKGATVVVTLRQQANVLLMDSSNYRIYAASRGGRFRYTGGLIKKSPARLTVPSNGHWYLAIDLGGAPGRINATIAVEPPPRGNLPEYRSAPEGRVSGQVSVRRPLPPESEGDFDGRTWDVFLSHASEDKTDVALPLAQALQDRGVSVWLDRAELRIGDSLRRRIDRGLRSSRFAAVVFSDAYFAKGWPQYELDGIVTLTVGGEQNLLPVWHNVDHAAVAAHSPSLADKFARSTSDTPISDIAEEIAELVIDARERQQAGSE